MKLSKDGNRQKGAALVIVLWTALLLSASLAIALAAARTDARLAAARKEAFLAEQTARNGLEYAAQWISTKQAGRLDGLSSLEFSLNGYIVSFAPSLENEKLDINLGSEKSFSAVFQLLGEEKAAADILAAKLADWRDEDNNPRPNGAERRDYVNAQNGEKIGNRFFYSADEIKLVLGMPSDIVECILPALTIFGDGRRPSNSLLHSLYGKDLGESDTVSSTRLGTASRSASTGARIAITATASKLSDAHRAPRAFTGVFRITGVRNNPFEWIAQFEVIDDKNPSDFCSRV